MGGAATRSATSPPLWSGGTASTATRSATTGGAATRPSPSSPTGSRAARPLRHHGPPAYASINFVTARRLRPERPGVVRAPPQRGQPRDNPRRRGPQPLLELRRRGPPGTAILDFPGRQRRNFLTACSSGRCPYCCPGTGSVAPGRQQQRYCQDNEVSWIDWSRFDEDLLAFTRRLIELRRKRSVPPAALVRRPAARRRGPRHDRRHRLVPTRQPPDDPRRLERQLRPHHRRGPQRRHDPVARARGEDHPTTSSASTLTTTASTCLPDTLHDGRWAVRRSTWDPDRQLPAVKANDTLGVGGRTT